MRTTKLDGNHIKEFIINTIAKDIIIESAIFDFIDNSINAAEIVTKQKLLQGSLSKYLTVTTLEHGVQIITLNDLESYKEYAPYIVIEDEVEFISKVVKM